MVYVPLVLVLTPSYVLHVICGFIIRVQEKPITLLTTEILHAINVLERSYLLLLHSSRNINIDNDSFQVESTFKDLGDTIDQCGGCSDAVSTCIVSS